MTDFVFAKYLRLSKDDTDSESMSIPHQRIMLDEFIEELGVPSSTVLEFEDNGFTGTNLNRPAVQEMLELVRCGRVNCIVVKDFSRFSRDAMESGYYIEQVFPLYGARFISVTDHYDSADYDGGTGGLDVAFKFLMHEHYSKDLSTKIKTAKHILMKNGEYIVGGAIYGYRKNDNGKWEHDPPAADVVRSIFNLALEGMTTAQIRDKLFADRQPAPREYEYLNKGKDITLKYNWATQRIWRMLTNEQYTGTYIAGKRESAHVGSKTTILKDRSEWIIIPDSHPPIVSKEDFERVQVILHAPKRLLSTRDGERSKQSKKLFDKASKSNCKYNSNLYGYVMNEVGTWDIDEVAAGIVKAMFNYVLQGFTVRDIAGKLQEEKHIPPGEHFKLARGRDVHPTYRWAVGTVRGILRNEQYTGAYIIGKTFQDNDGNRHNIPKDEWIIIPDRHPAIVSKEIFEQVQAMMSQGKRKMQPHNYLLKGKIVCGTCGLAMIYGNTTNEPMYRCMSTHADPAADCHKMKVATAEVEDTLMSIIKIQAGLILESGDIFRQRKNSGGIQQIAECEKQINALNEQRQGIYEQFVTGDVDRESYRNVKAGYTAQIDRLKNLIAALKQSELDSQARAKTADHAKSALSDTVTPREIVDALIEKVHVFPNDHLEITWKVSGFAAGTKI
jgi:DNA invertase Pin-like site-specific DNA recombinase